MKSNTTRSKCTRLIPRLVVLVASLAAMGAVQEAPGQNVPGKTVSDSRPSAKKTWVVQTPEEASTRARAILGLQEGVSASGVELSTLDEDNTPYLSGELAGRQLWRVTFGDEKIELPSATSGVEDAYLRTWEVYVRPEDGRVLKILSLWPDGIPLTLRGPNAETATKQLGVEVYHGFPDHDPPMTLMDALDALYQGGINPLKAKQIKGQYVLWSTMDRAPQPMWAITLRGILPLLVTPSSAAQGYGKKETQWRIIVDPQARKWVTAGNTPYAVEVELGASSSGERNSFGGIPPDGVEFYLYSPAHQDNVTAGQVIQWDITAAASTEGNEGLSMFSVDLVQDSATPNPNLIDIPRGFQPDPAGLMAGFNLSDGVCNPGPDGYGSGYGGSQIGLFGRKDLRQIGGGQNTFGVSGGSVGQDTIVELYIGHDPIGEIVASGDFDAPCTPGDYTFSIENGVAYLLDMYPGAPDVYWEVKQATVNIPTESASFTFTVDPGPACTGACCLSDLSCTVMTEAECDAIPLATYHGDDTVCAPDHGGVDCTMGACCRADGTCEDMTTYESCTGQSCPSGWNCPQHTTGGNEYMGAGTSCVSSACDPPPTGACCLVEGTCLPDQTEGECLTASGSYLGAWTNCSSTTCTGACCIDEQTCQDPMTAVQCYDAGGNYQGSDSTCAGATCITGACCLYGDFCMEVTSLACDYERGLYGGDGTDCESTFCDNCADGGGAARCPATEFNKLTANDAAANDRFGYSVAIDGGVAVAGSLRGDSGDDPPVIGSGCVYVTYRYDNDACIEEIKISAPDAAAVDEFGAAVAIAGDYMVVGAPLDDDSGGSSGSAYVFKYDGSTWEQDGPKLHASDGASDDRFGYSAAISGDGSVAVLGANQHDHSGAGGAGAAYVFRRYEDDYECSVHQDCVEIGLTKCGGGFCDGVAWVQEAKLVAPDPLSGAQFGTTVDIDYAGSTVVVGAPSAIELGSAFSGKAYVFEHTLGTWPVKAQLIPEVPMSNNDHNKLSMSISITDAGDTVLVGSPWDDDAMGCVDEWCESGAAYVYRIPGGGWSGVVNEDARITSCDLDPGDNFGWSVSISGDGSVALVGAPNAGDEFSIGGAAYAFRFNGTSWYEEGKFTASDESTSLFGFSTSLSDDTALVGAPRDDEVAYDAGGAYVFRGVGDCDSTESLDICEIMADASVDFPLAHDCCETGHGARCSDEGITACVCATDPYCCETYWDTGCAGLVDPDCASCGEGNGIPYACEACPADFDRDGDIDAFDLARLLGAWGDCPLAGECLEDISGDCEVGALDLAILLGSWGPCGSEEARWNGGPEGLRTVLGGGCLSLEEAVQMLGHDTVGEFIEWVLSEVPPDRVYHVAQFLLWLLDHWPC